MTNIAIICETDKGESRCASNPETVKKFIQAGFEITVQQGAGVKASIPDGAFQKAGAKIAKSAELAVKNADIVLAVRNYEIVKYMKPSAALIALLNPYGNPKAVKICMEAGVRAFALELIPRITRAQSMDVLSSQSNLAGYRAVLEAAYYYHAVFPMMMTAAGTLAPARMFIMGAGV
ncbi:MAG: NAD(P)(+) transhydrogenase (Re/Si-specific) subunit alpha, partial [Parvibaculales bacterium]